MTAPSLSQLNDHLNSPSSAWLLCVLCSFPLGFPTSLTTTTHPKCRSMSWWCQMLGPNAPLDPLFGPHLPVCLILGFCGSSVHPIVGKKSVKYTFSKNDSRPLGVPRVHPILRPIWVLTPCMSRRPLKSIIK